MSRVETQDHSELAGFDDGAEFEAFIASQQKRGVQIIGSQRDSLKRAMFCDDPYDSETISASLRLGTEEW